MAALQIFVGYTTADASYARQVAQALRQAGADVWDGHAPLMVATLDARTKKELYWRPVTIMILSPDSLRSVHLAGAMRIIAEDYQRDPDRIILPVVAEPCALDSFWLTLADFPRLEMAPGLPWPVEQTMQRVATALRLDGSQPAPNAPLEDLLRSALALGWQGEFDAALAALRLAQARDPDNTLVQIMQANALYLAHRYAEVVAIGDHLLTLAPHDAGILTIKGAALHQLGQTDAALAILQQAIDIDPHRLSTLLHMAHIQHAQQRYAAVLGLANQMAASDPEYYGVALYRSLALLALGRYADALPECRRACMLAPDSAVLWNHLTLNLRALRRFAEAETSADRVLALTPRDSDAWQARAEVLCYRQRYAEALAAFEESQGLRQPPVPFSSLHYQILIGLDRRNDAQTLLDAHITHGAESVAALTISGNAAHDAHDYPKALQAYARILELEPEDAHALAGAGNAHVRLGQPERGVALYEQALRARPHFAWLWRNYSWALSKVGRLPEALEAAGTALTLDPQDDSAWVRLSDALNQQRRYEDALEAADHALRLAPDNTAAWSQKSLALYKLGRVQESFAADTQVTRRKPPQRSAQARAWRLAVTLLLLLAVILGSYLLAAHLLPLGLAR